MAQGHGLMAQGHGLRGAAGGPGPWTDGPGPWTERCGGWPRAMDLGGAAGGAFLCRQHSDNFFNVTVCTRPPREMDFILTIP